MELSKPKRNAGSLEEIRSGFEVDFVSCVSRFFKAGDWGYMMSDGSFEICGRCDSMVKIRGYSVETQVGVLFHKIPCITNTICLLLEQHLVSLC